MWTRDGIGQKEPGTYIGRQGRWVEPIGIGEAVALTISVQCDVAIRRREKIAAFLFEGAVIAFKEHRFVVVEPVPRICPIKGDLAALLDMRQTATQVAVEQGADLLDAEVGRGAQVEVVDKFGLGHLIGRLYWVGRTLVHKKGVNRIGRGLASVPFPHVGGKGPTTRGKFAVAGQEIVDGLQQGSRPEKLSSQLSLNPKPRSRTRLRWYSWSKCSGAPITGTPWRKAW